MPPAFRKAAPAQTLHVGVTSADLPTVAGISKPEKSTVYLMPELTTRLAALRSGQVDWIEFPPTDAIPLLQQIGFQISLWRYPNIYPYAFNTMPGFPFADVCARQAVDYAIDRDSMRAMLNQTGKPTIGPYPLDHHMLP